MSNISNYLERYEDHPIQHWVIGNPARPYPRRQTEANVTPTATADTYAGQLREEMIYDLFNGVKDFSMGAAALLPIPVVGQVLFVAALGKSSWHLARAGVEGTHALVVKATGSRRLASRH